MPTAFDPLTGKDVDTASEEWRHTCECRWLLTAKPTKSQKHMHLFGVPDRQQLFAYDKTGRPATEPDVSKWQTKAPLMKFRGLAAADRLLADARQLYEKTK